MKGLIIQMKKFYKFFLVLFCILLISFSSVYAVEIDMNINNSSSNSIGNNTTDNTDNTDNNVISNNSTTQSDSPKLSTTQTTQDFELTVSDIINIILISVGIVLIFLAIAILIKIR